MGRIISLVVLVAGIWLLSVFAPWRPEASGPEAPSTQFSAARADAVLGRILGEQRPHPAGSPEAEAVRGRILQELSALGVTAHTQSGMSCYGERRWDNIPCATVTNIIAEAVPGTGKAVVLMAHSDSVAAGPGAGDDGSGVAILLETIRALKARHLEGAHPITAIFTDGEENGLLGASLFLRDRARRDGIGAVINVEASHCYPNFSRFLAEVARVLRPGGIVAYCARFQFKGKGSCIAPSAASGRPSTKSRPLRLKPTM